MLISRFCKLCHYFKHIEVVILARLRLVKFVKKLQLLWYDLLPQTLGIPSSFFSFFHIIHSLFYNCSFVQYFQSWSGTCESDSGLRQSEWLYMIQFILIFVTFWVTQTKEVQPTSTYSDLRYLLGQNQVFILSKNCSYKHQFNVESSSIETW